LRWFRRKKKTAVPLSEHERDVLARELKESAEHAMPSVVDENFARGGASYNNINNQARIVNGRGIEAIGERKMFEPRANWKPEDRDSL
jgi:hypothetical protein